MDQQQETRLTVVKNWMVPFVAAYERGLAPVRAFGLVFAAWIVRVTRRGIVLCKEVATATRAAWDVFAAHMGKRVVFVGYGDYVRMDSAITQLEAQALIVAAHLERREKRIKAYVGIARTLRELGRSAHVALAHAFSILQDQKYWTRKAGRVDSAMHYACSIAELAVGNGDKTLAFDAYTLAQQYGAKLDGHERRIRFAVMMADVAALVVPCDKPTWLAHALDIAISIEDETPRKRSVSSVATKMVADGLAPPAEDVHVTLLSRCADYGDYAVPEHVQAAVADEDTVDDMVDRAFDEHDVA